MDGDGDLSRVMFISWLDLTKCLGNRNEYADFELEFAEIATVSDYVRLGDRFELDWSVINVGAAASADPPWSP